MHSEARLVGGGLHAPWDSSPNENRWANQLHRLYSFVGVSNVHDLATSVRDLVYTRRYRGARGLIANPPRSVV